MSFRIPIMVRIGSNHAPGTEGCEWHSAGAGEVKYPVTPVSQLAAITRDVNLALLRSATFLCLEY